jgi:hypothetical protein
MGGTNPWLFLPHQQHGHPFKCCCFSPSSAPCLSSGDACCCCQGDGVGQSCCVVGSALHVFVCCFCTHPRCCLHCLLLLPGLWNGTELLCCGMCHAWLPFSPLHSSEGLPVLPAAAAAARVMEWDGAAVTAQRLVDLCCQGGDDDMFSTDLSKEQLQVRADCVALRSPQSKNRIMVSRPSFSRQLCLLCSTILQCAA